MKPDRLLVMNIYLCEHLVGLQGGLNDRLVCGCVGIIFDKICLMLFFMLAGAVMIECCMSGIVFNNSACYS